MSKFKVYIQKRNCIQNLFRIRSMNEIMIFDQDCNNDRNR